MTRDWKIELFWKLPGVLQEGALGLYARHLERVYYGAGYEEWRRKFIEWRKSWTWEEARAWQDHQLRRIVHVAATRVPYYRERWRHLEWRGVRSAPDLGLLPRLEKQELRQNEAAFLVDGTDPRSLWMDRTSGTTGTALKIYFPKTMLPAWWALTEVMVRNVAGVGQHVPRAMMGGRPIVPGRTTRPPYWRFNARWRQLYLSSYHVSRDTARAYVEAMRHYGSRWLTGYGSAIAALAECALQAGLPPVPLRAVIVSGDTLLPGMRASIEEFFQCKCFDHYGQSESVCMAMECLHGRMHVVPFAGIVEIVRDDGTSCVPGEIGELVVTGLLNDRMPLLRYRIGDYACWNQATTCECGNVYPVIESLEGRADDYIVTASGRKVGRLAAFRRSPSIHSAQLVQDSPRHAFLLFRPGRQYHRRDALAVRNDVLARVGDLEVDVLEVQEIPKTPQGKTVLVVRLEERPDMKKVYERLFTS